MCFFRVCGLRPSSVFQCACRCNQTKHTPMSHITIISLAGCEEESTKLSPMPSVSARTNREFWAMVSRGTGDINGSFVRARR